MSKIYLDRELLILAAKSMGYDTSHPWNAERMMMPEPEIGLCIPNVSTCWNLLEDDRDALRLAVQLKLDIMGSMTLINFRYIKDGCNTYSGLDEDPIAAVRWAIVQAAADIGGNIRWSGNMSMSAPLKEGSLKSKLKGRFVRVF